MLLKGLHLLKIMHFSLTFTGFLIAMSNAWGLFQIIIFLGYGVVTVPKHCLKMTDISKQYDYTMFRVTICEENLQNAKIELEDAI